MAPTGQSTAPRRARTTRTALASVLALGLALSGMPRVALAQAAEPTAQEREAAADAFDRGTRAFLARDYTRAGQWFETAYRMAPAAAALVGAVRAYERAGDHVRAATLALRLEAAHADEREAARQAQQTLQAHARQLVRIEVECDAECTVELDGALVDHPRFFVAPGTAHTVRATFETGAVDQAVASSEAGQRHALRFAAPPPPPPVVEVAETTPEVLPEDDEPGVVVAREEGGGGLHPAVAVTGLVLTAAAGGVLVWSGLDTLDGVPAYEANPTPEGLADGQSRELRTNVLIGATAGLAVATLVLLLLTDWDGSPSETDVQAFVAPVEGGAFAAVGGRF